MSILETVKNLFGFGPHQPAPQTTAPATATAAPVRQQAPAGPPPADQQRRELIRFILEKLRAYQNEPDNAPTGLRLFIACASAEDQELYRVVLWANKPGRFREELSRQLADNYIHLPADWRFDYEFFRDEWPACTYRSGNLGLVVLDRSKPDGPVQLATITALVGQTEQPVYPLDPTHKVNFCIGRGHTTQTASGRVRTNDIVIVNIDAPDFNPQTGAGNGAVSRSHATIRYDPTQRKYALLVDPGGLPGSGNKTKIMHPDETVERADIGGMGYPLQDGDQIELGGEVVLLFELR